MNKFIIIVFAIIATASPTFAKGTRGNGKILDATVAEGNLSDIYDFFNLKGALETISLFVKNLFQVDSNDSEQSCCGECWCMEANI
jgi:hypothetical protein